MKFRNHVALAGVVAALCSATAPTAFAKELSDQQKLIERMKIEELLYRSGWAFDSHDIDGWIATFTPDGEWDTQYVTCKGPEALRAYVTKGFNCVGVPGGAAVPGAPPRMMPGAAGGAGGAPPGGATAGGPPAGFSGPPPGGGAPGAGGPPGGGAPTAGGPPGGGAPGAGGPPGGAGGRAEHFISDPIYEFIDDNTVHYKAYWMTVSGAGEAVGGRIASVGYYDDTIVKVNGKWLIKKRQLKH